MSLKILGVITDEKIDKVKVLDKYVNDLSNILFDANIQHLIIEDSIYGIGIMLIEDAPSLLIHNESDKQWVYLSKYMNDKNKPILEQTYVIKESNILEFLKIVLKVSEEK